MHRPKLDINREIIDRYTDQPATLPRDLWSRVKNRIDDQDIRFYALTDLDEDLNLAGNIFLVPNPDSLDQQSRKILWAFVD